jgi:hypothetical protein
VVEVKAAAVEEDGGLIVIEVAKSTDASFDGYYFAVDPLDHRVVDAMDAAARHVHQPL